MYRFTLINNGSLPRDGLLKTPGNSPLLNILNHLPHRQVPFVCSCGSGKQHLDQSVFQFKFIQRYLHKCKVYDTLSLYNERNFHNHNISLIYRQH